MIFHCILLVHQRVHRFYDPYIYIYYIYISIEAIKHGDLFQSKALNCQKLVSKSDFFDDLMTAQNMNMKRCLFTPIAGKGIQEAIVILADRLGHLRRMAWTEKRRSVCWLLSGNTAVENGWQLPIYRWIIYIYNINLPWFTYQKWWFSISYVTFPEGQLEVGQVVAFSTTLRSTHFMARHATYDHIPCWERNFWIEKLCMTSSIVLECHIKIYKDV